jgi:hypothetical protein
MAWLLGWFVVLEQELHTGAPDFAHVFNGVCVVHFV